MSDDDKIIEFRKKESDDKDEIEEILGNLEDIEEDFCVETESDEDAEIIVDAVNKLLRAGIENNASSIHLESFKDEYIYRFEINGKLSERFQVDREFYPGMITRLKIMAGVDIAERRFPQDGKIKVKLKGEDDIHLFFAYFLPTIYKENVTLRLFSDPSGFLLNLSDQVKKIINGVIERRPGLIVLISDNPKHRRSLYYSVMDLISDPNKRVVNIHEASPEVKLDNISNVTHMGINSSIGLDSGRAFRAAIAVSPSVIMMDSVNTKEFKDFFPFFFEGDFCYVISTTATSPLGFIKQVQDQGIDLKDLFLVKPLFININFYDRVCTKCGEEISFSEGEKNWLEGMGFDTSGSTPRKAIGCKDCLGTGYSGQDKQEEILPIEDEIIAMNNGLDEKALSFMSNGFIKIPDLNAIITRIMRGDFSHESLFKIQEGIDEWNRS